MLLQNPSLTSARWGRNVVFGEDPPPDLVVDVDIIHTDIAKNQFYASLGVPEFWRFNGRVWRVYVLQDSVYGEAELSPTFPQVSKERLYEFLSTAKDDEIAAVQDLRDWWQANN